MMACEGCGSTRRTVWLENNQVTWCAQPSGCNTDSYTSKIMDLLSNDFHHLPPRSYVLKEKIYKNDNGDLVIPQFNSFIKFKAWLIKRIDANIERIGEELGL